jgi:hypothetical protein
MNGDVNDGQGIVEVHVQGKNLGLAELYYGNKSAYSVLQTPQLQKINLERWEEKAKPPSLARVQQASHVMDVRCDVGARNSDHKCGATKDLEASWRIFDPFLAPCLQAG